MAAAVRPDPRPRYVRFVVLTPRAGGGYEVPTLTCPHGHEVRANVVMHEGAALFTCQWRPHSARRDNTCGVTLFVVAGCKTPTGAPAWYYAHVTPGELARLEKSGLDADGMMRTLNES